MVDASLLAYGQQETLPDADGQFVNAPYFYFHDGQLKFNTNRLDNANDNFGSVSGFVPKSLFQKERFVWTAPFVSALI